MADVPGARRLRLAELAGSLSLATDLGLGHPLGQLGLVPVPEGAPA